MKYNHDETLINYMKVTTIFIWASSRENLSSGGGGGGSANNTGADQPAHPRSLISAFVIRFLKSTISTLATGEISIC